MSYPWPSKWCKCGHLYNWHYQKNYLYKADGASFGNVNFHGCDGHGECKCKGFDACIITKEQWDKELKAEMNGDPTPRLVLASGKVIMQVE